MTLHKAKTRIGNILTPRPNWAEKVVEEYAFETRIFMSRDGTEQRDAQRTIPRVSVEFTADQTDTRAQRLLIDAQNQIKNGLSTLPVRWRSVRLGADVSVGAAAITLDQSAPWWIKAGEKLVLESSDTQEEIEVGGISGTTINLAAVTQAAFSAGDSVMLGLRGRIADQASMRGATNTHKRYAFRFDVDPGTWGALPDTGTLRAFEGHPICPVSPNWRDPINYEVGDMREVSDHRRGVIDVTYPVVRLDLSEQWTFTGMTQAQVDELIAFFGYVRGRQRPFYVPSKFTDHTVASESPAGSQVVTVEGQEVAPAFFDDTIHTAIVARWPDGCVQYNRVDSYAFSGDDTVITVRDPWERDIGPTVELSWSYLCRMMGDRLTVQWVSDQAAEVMFGVKMLPSAWVDELDSLPTYPVARCTNNNLTGEPTPGTTLTKPTGIIDLPYMGYPLGLIDEGKAVFYQQMNFTLNPDELDTVTLWSMRVWFFDENGNSLLNDDPITMSVSDSVTYPQYSSGLTYSFLFGPVQIPPGTRDVRFRAATSDSPDPFEAYGWIDSKNWGRLIDPVRLKCQ